MLGVEATCVIYFSSFFSLYLSCKKMKLSSIGKKQNFFSYVIYWTFPSFFFWMNHVDIYKRIEIFFLFSSLVRLELIYYAQRMKKKRSFNISIERSSDINDCWREQRDIRYLLFTSSFWRHFLSVQTTTRHASIDIDWVQQFIRLFIL